MSRYFRPAVDLLAAYARAHRDRRNIQTHVVGVPMMVFAAGVLLSWPALTVGGWMLTPAWALLALAALWYLTRGHTALGLSVVVSVAALFFVGQQVSGPGVVTWLSFGVVPFVLGWLVQMVGHYYEGRRPASVDSPVNLLVAPMFVALELLSGWRVMRPLAAEVTRRAGPVHVRDLAHPLPQR